jgi:tetratricopeptide (TPR) repeat protein
MRRYLRRLFQWVWGRPPPASEVWERDDWGSEEELHERRVAHATRGIAEAYRARAMAYRDSVHGDTSEALADLTAAVETDPTYAEAYRSRGVVLLGQGDYYGAMADFNKALELDPKWALGYYTRGMALLDHDHRDQAIADLRRVIELQPESECAHAAGRWVPDSRAG